VGFCSTLSALADDTGYPAPSATKLGWRVSVQGWVYRRFPLFKGLEMATAIGLRNFEIRTNLKLDDNRPGVNADENMPDDARNELKTRLADNGLSVPTIFTDFNGQPDQAKRLFDFWKDFGTEVFTAEPPRNKECIDMLEKLCDEYRICLALHNHQRERSEYWSPEIVLEMCEGRGPYVGATADGGQWARSNLDPVECLKKLEGRILNFHLKDILIKGELFCRNTVIGEGQGSCAESLQELARQGYKRVITIDFEHDTPALQEDMVKNIAFIEDHAKRVLTR
jgi:sugar phosphate isomerase/epimerase